MCWRRIPSEKKVCRDKLSKTISSFLIHHLRPIRDVLFTLFLYIFNINSFFILFRNILDLNKAILEIAVDVVLSETQIRERVSLIELV